MNFLIINISHHNFFREKNIQINQKILKLCIKLFQPKESRSGLSDFEGSTSIRRSHSQTNINKPSSDLLGLTLHNFDPIDPVSSNKTEDKDSVEVVAADNNENEDNVKSGFTDLTSTLLNLNVSGNQQETAPADTSHEVQDILR